MGKFKSFKELFDERSETVNEKYKIEEAIVVNKIDLKSVVKEYEKLEKSVKEMKGNIKNITQSGFNIPDKAVQNIIDNTKKAQTAINEIGNSF